MFTFTFIYVFRKRSENIDCRPKKVVVDCKGVQKKIWSQENFATDEDWVDFMRLITAQRAEKKVSNNKFRRYLRQLKSYKQTISALEKRNELNAVQYLKV